MDEKSGWDKVTVNNGTMSVFRHEYVLKAVLRDGHAFTFVKLLTICCSVLVMYFLFSSVYLNSKYSGVFTQDQKKSHNRTVTPLKEKTVCAKKNTTSVVGSNMTYSYKGLHGKELQISKILGEHIKTLDCLSVDKVNPKDLKRFPIVTGASSNHYQEAFAMIRTVREVLPDHPIVYFDLGLTPKEQDEVISLYKRPISKLFPSLLTLCLY